MKTILAVIGAVGILFGGGFVCGATVVLVGYGKHPDMGHRHVHEIAEACGVKDHWIDLDQFADEFKKSDPFVSHSTTLL